MGDDAGSRTPPKHGRPKGMQRDDADGSVERNQIKRGSQTRYDTSSYAVIARCTGKTRVSYAPNPKYTGTASFDRYAKYENAKTVGEALKHCRPADLLWDYEK